MQADVRDVGSIPGSGIDDLLEEGMTSHSRILAWRIQWTEEPGGLQSLGSQSQFSESVTTEMTALRHTLLYIK